jgi:hypothetical protein
VAGSTDLDVAFMRCAYEIDLESNILSVAVRAEDLLSKRGCRIVNPVISTMLSQRKDLVYATLEKHRIPVPEFLPSPTLQETLALIRGGHWKYPFMYRAADSSGGKDTFVVRSEADLRAAFRDIRSKRGMLVELIDSQSSDPSGRGLYCRWRFFVIGNRLDQYSLAMSKNPIIRHESGSPVPPPPESWVSRIVGIGKALGIHVFCADVVADSLRWAVVDVNPTYTYSSDPIACPPAIQERRNGHTRRLLEYLDLRGAS